MSYIVKRSFPDSLKQGMVDHFVEVTEPRLGEFVYHGDFISCKGDAPVVINSSAEVDNARAISYALEKAAGKFVSYIPKDESQLTWEKYPGETKRF
jgi:hypothetical protein